MFEMVFMKISEWMDLYYYKSRLLVLIYVLNVLPVKKISGPKKSPKSTTLYLSNKMYKLTKT